MNKIQEVEMFRTPDNWQELHDWINRHSSEERPHLIVAAVMAWNLACSLVNE